MEEDLGNRIKELKKIEGKENHFNFIDSYDNISYSLSLSNNNGELHLSLSSDIINQNYESSFNLEQLHVFKCLSLFETLDEILDEFRHNIENSKFQFSKKENEIILSFTFSTLTKDILIRTSIPS
jgi:hypothetical protein